MSTSESEQATKLKTQTRLTLIVAFSFAAILPIAYVLWFGLWNKVPAATANAATWGAFGDFVGGLLNPLVAFLALFWLTRSIEIQREELSATKEELSKAKLAQQDQARTLEKQRFEDTFFSLLDQHNAVLTNLTAGKGEDGEDHSTARTISQIIFRRPDHTLKEANAALKQFDYACGHYFRIVYQLLKLIATRTPNTSLNGEFTAANLLATMPSDDEKLYSNIVRAFIDLQVTQILAVNCYCEGSESSHWKFKCLLERYEFLEHMSFEPLYTGGNALHEAVQHYDRRAFGGSDFIARKKDECNRVL